MHRVAAGLGGCLNDAFDVEVGACADGVEGDCLVGQADVERVGVVL